MSDRVVIDGDMSLTSTIDGEGGAVIRLGQNPVIEPLNVTENGTHSVSDGVDGFNPVTVAIPAIRLYSSKKVEAYAYYDTFKIFKQAVFPDLPMDKDIIVIEFENNTSNKRAGVYWVQIKLPKTNQVTSYGSRVGASFGDANGCNVYAGATINVYVGDY